MKKLTAASPSPKEGILKSNKEISLFDVEKVSVYHKEE